jgi:hypothetical protein
MKIFIRSYCYGCGARNRFTHDPYSRMHHREWMFWISCDGVRLKTVQGFHSWAKAAESAERSYRKLSQVSCVRTDR